MRVVLGPMPCAGCALSLALVELDETYPHPRLRTVEDATLGRHACPSPVTHRKRERARLVAAGGR